MSSQVHVFVVGHLGKDAQLQFLASGTPILKFSVAAKVGFGEREQTQWLSCSLFGKRAEALQPYLTKGTRVSVAGTLSQAVNQENNWFNVNVDHVSLEGGGSNGQTEAEAEPVAEPDAVPF